MRPWARWVHLESLGSFGWAVGDVGFIRSRYVRSGTPWGSLGSLWVVEIVRVRHGCRWVHSGSLGSFVCKVGVVGFIRGRSLR